MYMDINRLYMIGIPMPRCYTAGVADGRSIPLQSYTRQILVHNIRLNKTDWANRALVT